MNGQYCRSCLKEYSREYKEKRGPLVQRDKHLQHLYKITLVDLERMLFRQHYKCLGCLGEITISSPVDHDHATGHVRGVLCDNCNHALGNVRESKATLRRLTAYLDYDRTRARVHIIGSLRNDSIPDIAAVLRERGYEVVDEWHSAGPEADDYWQAYEDKRGRTYVEALKGRQAENIFLFDMVHIDLADCVVLVMPAGKSSHLELGYAIGGGKLGIVLLDGTPDRYDVMPNLAASVCANLDDLTTLLAEVLPINPISKEGV